MLTELRQIQTALVAENPYWKYRLDRYTLPDGSEGEYHYVQTPGSVMVVPVTERGTLLLVRQYRYLNRRVSIEFPGGGVKTGLGAEESARSELREEAAFECGNLRHLGDFNPMNGVTDELCRVFAATDLKPTASSPDTSEEFELQDLELHECFDLIKGGEIWDGMTIAALAIFQEHSKMG